jgi:hypothetical protein
MPTMTLPTAAIQAFADAVRVALSDLPVDEVEDLTDGLEADLTERFDDTGTDFGDPDDYADELRAAAGLPPRGKRAHTSASSILTAAAIDAAGAFRSLYEHRFTRRIAGFFVSLRPLWWLFRGLVFYFLVTLLFRVPPADVNPITFFLAAAALIVSVQFGRGKWLPRQWMRRGLLVVNVLLVLAVPTAVFGIAAIFGAGYSSAYASSQADPAADQQGLFYNDNQVTNIFAYDANGHPLTDVQLFDQSGQPLNTVDDPTSPVFNDGTQVYVPNNSVIGRSGWNVYPLLTVPADQLDVNGLPVAGAVPVIPSHENATVQPLANQPTPSPTSAPTPSPTPAP